MVKSGITDKIFHKRNAHAENKISIVYNLKDVACIQSFSEENTHTKQEAHGPHPSPEPF
jgi:hypothetical protein